MLLYSTLSSITLAKLTDKVCLSLSVTHHTTQDKIAFVVIYRMTTVRHSKHDQSNKGAGRVQILLLLC